MTEQHRDHPSVGEHGIAALTLLPHTGIGSGGHVLKLTVGGNSALHTLAGIPVPDDAVIELLTDNGWVSGHYRATPHPETAESVFEVHAHLRTDKHQHIRMFVPLNALFRWPGRAL